eukprot:gene24338-9954_t
MASSLHSVSTSSLSRLLSRPSSPPTSLSVSPFSLLFIPLSLSVSSASLVRETSGRSSRQYDSSRLSALGAIGLVSDRRASSLYSPPKDNLEGGLIKLSFSSPSLASGQMLLMCSFFNVQSFVSPSSGLYSVVQSDPAGINPTGLASKSREFSLSRSSASCLSLRGPSRDFSLARQSLARPLSHSHCESRQHNGRASAASRFRVLSKVSLEQPSGISLKEQMLRVQRVGVCIVSEGLEPRGELLNLSGNLEGSLRSRGHSICLSPKASCSCQSGKRLEAPSRFYEDAQLSVGSTSRGFGRFRAVSNLSSKSVIELEGRRRNGFGRDLSSLERDLFRVSLSSLHGSIHVGKLGARDLGEVSSGIFGLRGEGSLGFRRGSSRKVWYPPAIRLRKMSRRANQGENLVSSSAGWGIERGKSLIRFGTLGRGSLSVRNEGVVSKVSVSRLGYKKSARARKRVGAV